MLSDPTLFNPGETWLWSDPESGGVGWPSVVVLLIERDFDNELGRTIRTTNQQSWMALDLESGVIDIVRMHTSVFGGGQRWVKL
jgi:hypothetical protein